MNAVRCGFLVTTVVLLGCGGNKSVLPTATVSGTITYQGKPLTVGEVIFFHKSGQAVSGEIGTDGTFKLAAFQGKNQVAVDSRAPDQPNPNSGGRPRVFPGKSLIPNRYADASTSDITIDVKPGDNKLDITL